MRTKIFFYADPHFCHEEIIEYCKRPFVNVEEMNETLIKNYNYLVKENDIVYFLGDVGFDKYDNLKVVFSRLKGKKLLVKGNHDKASKSFYRNLGFFDVVDSARVAIGKNIKINLQHYPSRNLKETLEVCKCYFFNDEKKRPIKARWNRVKKELKRYKDFHQSKKYITAHGHVHERFLKRGRNINCSVDVWNFYPVPIDEFLNLVKNKKVKNKLFKRRNS